MLKLSETNLVHYCISYLSLKGHYIWRQNTGTMKLEYKGKPRFFKAGFIGVSDVLGIEKGTGKFIAIECKIAPNKPTPAQEQFLQDVRDHGGIALVIYSTDEIERAFK